MRWPDFTCISKPSWLQPLDQRLMIAHVAVDAVLQTLFFNEFQALAERIEQGTGRGVMILAAVVILLQEAQIEVPFADGSLACGEPLQGARGGGKGRQTRRAAQALLRTAIGDINEGIVHVYSDGAQGGYRVGNYEGIHRASRFGDSGGVLERAGGGFGVDEGNHGGTLTIEKFGGFAF